MRPSSIHLWRQADCLSFTLNYYQENRPFFEPAIHFSGSNGTGKTVSEFPIIYYSVAQLWKIFGQKESIFRLVNLLLVYLGLFYLFKLLKELLGSGFWGLYIPVFLFTSPVLVSYSISFLSNAPAFGCALTACYFYWRHYKTGKYQLLILSMLLFLLGGLMKITALTSFVAILGIHFLQLIEVIIKKNRRHIRRMLTDLVPFLTVIILLFSWVMFTKHYNQLNLSGLFLQDVFPIWKLDPEKISDTAYKFYHNLLPRFFPKLMLVAIFILFIINIVRYKITNQFLLLFNVLVFIGTVLYLILWFKAFDVHDYYMLNLLIFPVATLVTFFDLLKNNAHKLFHGKPLKFLALALLLFSVYNAYVQNRMRYDKEDLFVKNSFLLDKAAIDYWDWQHWSNSIYKKPYHTITPYLRSIGIDRDDKVISMPDTSPNITLYLMDQKGYTEFGFVYEGKKRMEHFISIGAKYLIIHRAFLDKVRYLKPFLKKKMGTYQDIEIYDLRNLSD